MIPKVNKVDSIKDNIYKFRDLVLHCMRDDIWYLTWKDLNDKIDKHIKTWLIYLSTVYPNYNNQFEPKEYVLQTILYTLWKLRRVVGQIFPFKVDDTHIFDPYLYNFILQAKLSFKLTMVIVLKLTGYKYTKLSELYCQRYYAKKIRTIVPKNDEKHYNLLIKIKPYLPRLYYAKLNNLSLSTKQWTAIFIYEVQTWKKTGYFANYDQISYYFRGKSILNKVVIKKFGRYVLL